MVATSLQMFTILYTLLKMVMKFFLYHSVTRENFATQNPLAYISTKYLLIQEKGFVESISTKKTDSAEFCWSHRKQSHAQNIEHFLKWPAAVIIESTYQVFM